MKTRWYQFARSAFERKSGHSGGWSFSREFFDRQKTEPSWLYVAALPVLLDEPRRSAWIRHVERQLIWEYVERFERLPVCNSK